MINSYGPWETINPNENMKSSKDVVLEQVGILGKAIKAAAQYEVKMQGQLIN